MKISEPCCITSRLLPGIRIGNVSISIEYATRPGDEGRTRYRWYIDGLSQEYSGDELQSRRGNCNLQSGLESLLSFFAAEGNFLNDTLFPLEVTKWAAADVDELSMLEHDLGEFICIEE